MAQIINLDIVPKGIPDVINVGQFDEKREIVFNMYEFSSPYTILTGAIVTIAGRKGDNHVFVYSSNDGLGVVTILDGNKSVKIKTTQQMTAYAGENICQLRIEKDGVVLATVNFKMFVQERPDANGDYSDSDIPGIVALAREQQYNAEAWAQGTYNGSPVTSGMEQYNNYSKYWAERASEYATNGVVYKGSILYANIPTSNMKNGDMYNITDEFTTDNRFSEGTGKYCPAGTNIIWNNTSSLWDISGGIGGVQSFNGRHGVITPAANDYDATQIKYGTSSNVNAELANKANQSELADEFDPDEHYYVGDVCTYEGNMYRFIAEHNAIAWRAADVIQINVGDQITNYKTEIITVPSTGWSSTVDANNYYTQTVVTPTFGTHFIGKVSCCGSTATIPATAEQEAAYANVQNPNGYIEQVDSTHIKLYAKVKPTITFYIMMAGYGLGVQFEVSASDPAKQNKILDTSLTIGGQSKTTVETALDTFAKSVNQMCVGSMQTTHTGQVKGFLEDCAYDIQNNAVLGQACIGLYVDGYNFQGFIFARFLAYENDNDTLFPVFLGWTDTGGLIKIVIKGLNSTAYVNGTNITTESLSTTEESWYKPSYVVNDNF